MKNKYKYNYYLRNVYYVLEIYRCLPSCQCVTMSIIMKYQKDVNGL